ncbi:DDE-domain-containing protein [Schizopora paradoxa]|uniref:DDE-domain-containing protein n=1 Tax=Schizopora paradoxa TaxID=27342 RepID=A0A0H2S0H7_9AGAM|nr:DDE-domain-containing protein [Schizopora paradoxa]
MPPTLTQKSRKPRRNDKPYQKKPGPKPKKDALPASQHGHKTSAKPKEKKHRDNLTLADWMMVFAYIDEHPTSSQTDIVNHFHDRHEGALVFTQGTLSRKIKKRAELEERVNSTPTALDSKRPRVVTRPDVEEALVLWVRHMEQKGETVSGKMLVEKRKRFEERMEIPEAQRLQGEGWVQKFCRTYKLRSIKRHGEAGSVDLEAVKRERERVAKILSSFAPRDRWNMDETGLFAFAPPDRGLATEQMKGKKTEKFRITLAFACNADGSEREEPFFIGKSKMPRCFNKQSPESRGFYYRNNKNAWMTAVFFEEWLKKIDLKMQRQNRHVCLLVDNFSGHVVPYTPTNVRLEFFEPNMTSFVQPLDAGIIRCMKAHYRSAFCNRAIDLDEAGEREVYKINLLEAMLMAKAAWYKVKPETIANCWNHAKIQPTPNNEKYEIY